MAALTIQKALAKDIPSREKVLTATRSLGKQLISLKKAYEDGLPAEQISLSLVLEELKQKIFSEFQSTWGRKIDLIPLLDQRRKDGMPVWALMDPRFVLNDPTYGNGRRDADGQIRVGKVWAFAGLSAKPKPYPENGRSVVLHPSGGIPPIPPKVRKMIRSNKVEKHSQWVGLLYQPEDWEKHIPNPDPALVVKWKNVPGYFCLAAWGADRSNIAEFIH